MPTPFPATVDDVIDRLGEIQRSLRPGDGLAVFIGMYLDVTERFATRSTPATTVGVETVVRAA